MTMPSSNIIFLSLCICANLCVFECNGDVLSFDWSTLSEPKNRYFDSSSSSSSDRQFYQHYHAPPIAHKNDLESDFGVFETKTHQKPTSSERPRFQTVFINNNAPDFSNEVIDRVQGQSQAQAETYVQKIPRLEVGSSERKRVNNLLKNYLAKMYLQKYQQSKKNKIIVDGAGGQSSAYEGKIFDGSLFELKNKTKNLANKFLSLFTVVKFENSECETSSTSGDYSGTCYHETECQNMNGTAVGTCASDYGVCCVFRYSCGATSAQNCTYFESPGYPNYDPPGNMVVPPTVSPTMPPPPTGGPTPDPRKYYIRQRRRWKRQTDSTASCSINIQKLSDDIQQIKIDFIDLELAGPTNGMCVDERLIISGQNVNDQVPVICGYNSGQHVYVDVSMLTGPLQLAVVSNTGARKRFKIRICQIAAPSCTNTNNCLQYYTGVTGMFSSFNYDQAVVNRSVPGYYNNLNYAICIRKEAGYCSITYSNNPAGVEYPFEVRNVNDAGESTVPPGQAGAEIFNCPDDYLVIGGIRLCGYKFNDGAIIDDFTMNAPVTDTSAGPIIIPIRTNSAVTGRGFKLFYTQNRCTNT